MGDAKPAAMPLELGWGQVCINAADIKKSVEFYTKLGFIPVGGNIDEGWCIMGNGATELGIFTGHIHANIINFRGADIDALRTEMKARGFELEGDVHYTEAKLPDDWKNDKDGNPLPMEGSGCFTIKDPGGMPLFFDTVPIERVAYNAGQKFSVAKISGELFEGQPLIGNLTFCLSVASAKEHAEWYRRAGFIEDEGNVDEGWMVMQVTAPHVFKVGLFEKEHVGEKNSLNFRGGDVFAIAERLKAEGIEFKRGPEKEEDGSDGLWVEDPDGNPVYFNTAPYERLY